MVVAHLRGLLRKNHNYGERSIITEDIVLESLSAEILAGSIQASTTVELALIPALKPEGITQVHRQTGTRLQRAGELRLLDIYRVSEQIASGLKRANPKNELSLFQLYQIAEKSGIFDTLDEHYREENSRPLL